MRGEPCCQGRPLARSPKAPVAPAGPPVRQGVGDDGVGSVLHGLALVGAELVVVVPGAAALMCPASLSPGPKPSLARQSRGSVALVGPPREPGGASTIRP